MMSMWQSPYLQIVINILFLCTALIYTQFTNFSPYMLTIKVVLIILSLIVAILVKRRICIKIFMIDYSPMIIEILILTSLINDFEETDIFYLLFGFLLGHMSGLQKIYDDKENKYKYWIAKTILQQLVLIIFSIISDDTKLFKRLMVMIVLILLVGVQDIGQTIKKYHKGPYQSTNQSITYNQKTSPSLFVLAEKYLDNWVACIGYKNKALTVENLSLGLQSYLADKKLSLDNLLNKIQIVNINLDMENIMTNSILQTKSKLYNFISQKFAEEIGDTLKRNQRAKEAEQMVSPNDSKRRITLTQRQDIEQLKRGQTIQLNQFSMQYFGDNQSNSLVSLLQVFNHEQMLNNNLKKSIYNNSQQGIISLDDGSILFVKITLHFISEGNDIKCLLIIENNNSQFQQYLEFLQVGLKSESSQKCFKELARKTDGIKRILTQMTSQQLQQSEQVAFSYLQQILAQVYFLSNSSQNLLDFLTEDAQFYQSFRQQEFRIDHLLSQMIDKIKYHPLVKEKKIQIVVQNSLKDQGMCTDLNKVRQFFINFLLNSIKQLHDNNNTTNLTIQINLQENLHNQISVEIIDCAGGFSQHYDFQRIRDGQLGLFINLKILPNISKTYCIEQRNIQLGNGEKGCSINFVLLRHMKEKHCSQSQKLAYLKSSN